MELKNQQPTGKYRGSWHEVPLPTHGRCPDWIKDVHVHWLPGYASDPRIYLKVLNMPHMTKPWSYDGKGMYFRATDELREQFIHHAAKTRREDGSYETSQDRGYGGREFTLQMDDGLTVHLLGPWSGSHPDGWNEYAYVEMNCDYYRRNMKLKRDWFNTVATAGTAFSDTLILQAIAKFAPHLRMAKLEQVAGVQPYMVEWGGPKHFRPQHMKLPGE